MGAAADLALALDHAAFARELAFEPDPWQERLLRSTSDRVLLSCFIYRAADFGATRQTFLASS